MTCDMALEAISAALDGGLSDAERAELEAHLAICPACRALCEDLKAIREDVLDSELEVPAGFHDKVMAAVAEEPSLTPVKRKKKQPWKAWGSLAAVAAIAVLAVGPGLLPGMGGSGGAAAPAAANSMAENYQPAPAEAVADVYYEASGASGDVGEEGPFAASNAPQLYSDSKEELPTEAPKERSTGAEGVMPMNLEDAAAEADYRAILTVEGPLPEGYAWEESGVLELPVEELPNLRAALDAAGTAYTLQDSGDGVSADGTMVLVQPVN